MKEKIIEHIITSIDTHWRIWSWLGNKVKKHINKYNIYKPRSLNDLWSNIFTGIYKNGDFIQLNDWFVTEWIPKQPGRYWFNLQNQINSYNSLEGIDLKMSSVFQFRSDLSSKRKEELTNLFNSSFELSSSQPGLMYEYDQRKLEQGVARLLPQSDKNNCMVLNLVNAEDWRCERGIPLIVSTQVYKEYLRAKQKFNSVEISLDGILEINSINPLLDSYIKTIGESDANFYKEFFLKQLDIPSAYIRVVSPLDVKFRTHSHHPLATITTIGEFLGPHIKTEEWHDFSFFYQSYVVDPSKEESINEAVKYFTEKDVFKYFPYDYLLDFDGQRRRFISKLPIRYLPSNDIIIKNTRKMINN